MAYDCNVAIDLEFTPAFAADKPRGLRAEIIEIGAVMLDANGVEVGTFSKFVRPVYATKITRRVRRVTGIHDNDLAHAEPFEEVLPLLTDWIGPLHARMITWGSADCLQIVSECKAKGIPVALPGRWLDLQRVYSRFMGDTQKMMALGKAADECGIVFDRRHRALCDARATGQIFRMAAKGELTVQRQLLESGVKSAPSTESCVAIIAERCGNGLAELFASLAAQEQMACA